MKQSHLRNSEFFCLKIANDNETFCYADIKSEEFSEGAIWNACKTLSTIGLIERCKDDEHLKAGRPKIVFKITDKGKFVLQKAKEYQDAIND